jgi:hypothetical protein
MLCPNCGQENPSAFGYCAGCHRPLSTVGGAAAMPGFSPQSLPPQARTMSLVAKIFLIAVVALVLFVGVTKPIDAANPAEAAGQRFGALLVMLGLPLLVAWLVAGRRTVRHPNRFALVFCLVGGFLALSNAVSMLNFETPEEHFSRLMREAAGVQAESHRGSASQQRFDHEIRGQYRKLLQQNRDYAATVKNMDISKIKDLNSAAGFANPDFAREGLDQLHALYGADAGQEQKLSEIMTGLRHILETQSGSASEREAMLKGFDSSSAAQLSRRQAALASEKAWVDAVDDVHAYADAHHDNLKLIGGHLIIFDAAVRTQFNAKVDLQEQKRKAFLAMQQQFNQSQAQSLQKMGLSGKDVGNK